MERLALQRLLGGINEGQSDVVVVYRVGRLTRLLVDPFGSSLAEP